jgi:hypothetical protein
MKYGFFSAMFSDGSYSVAGTWGRALARVMGGVREEKERGGGKAREKGCGRINPIWCTWPGGFVVGFSLLY